MAFTIHLLQADRVWKCFLLSSRWYNTVHWFYGSPPLLGSMLESVESWFRPLTFQKAFCSTTLMCSELSYVPKILQHFQESLQRDSLRAPHLSCDFALVSKGIGHDMVSKIFNYHLTLIMVLVVFWLHHNDQQRLCPPAKMDEESLTCSFALLTYCIKHWTLGDEVRWRPNGFLKNQNYFFPIISFVAHFNLSHNIIDIQKTVYVTSDDMCYVT